MTVKATYDPCHYLRHMSRMSLGSLPLSDIDFAFNLLPRGLTAANSLDICNAVMIDWLDKEV